MASKTQELTESVRTAARICWRAAASGHAFALAACLAFAVTERVGGVAAALAWHTSSFSYVLGALIPIALGHRLIRMHLRRSNIATTFQRIIDAVTDDELDIRLGPGGTAAVVDAVGSVARAVGDVAVPFVADVVAMLFGIAVLIQTSAFPLLGGAVVALMILLAATSLLTPAKDPTFERYLAVADRVADALDGRTELLASGATEGFMRDARASIEDWRAAARSSMFRALHATRWSVAALAAAALFVLLSRGLEWALVKQALLVAVVAPLTLGALQSAFALSKLANQIAPLGPLFADRTARKPGEVVAAGATVRWDRVTIALGERVVLSDVSFAAVPGQVVAVTGANGAGKTTLLLATLGLRRCRSGRILVADTDLSSCDRGAWRARVQYLPQSPYLMPRRTVRDALQFPARRLTDEEMEMALRRVGLWDRLHARSAQPLGVVTDGLSAGERQRLALGRMLSRDSDVYLLDEPDGNLDSDATRMVVDVVRGLAGSGKLVIFAAHSTEMVRAADQVLRIVDGRVEDVSPRSSERLEASGT